MFFPILLIFPIGLLDRPGFNLWLNQIMVLDISLLNTQHYKVRMKGKVEQSKEMSNALP